MKYSNTNRKFHQGLTLIEVLIALAIIAIALTAILKATTEDIADATYLENKTVATWVAESTITAIQLDIFKPPYSGQYTVMFGKRWYWNAKVSKATPYVSRITVNVSDKQGAQPMVTLHGFKGT